MKEEYLPWFVNKHLDEVDVSDSIDPPTTMQNFLLRRYRVLFNKKQVTKHYNKLVKQRKLRREREEATRRALIARDMRRLLIRAKFEDLAAMRARNENPWYFGHFFIWNHTLQQ